MKENRVESKIVRVINLVTLDNFRADSCDFCAPLNRDTVHFVMMKNCVVWRVSERTCVVWMVSDIQVSKGFDRKRNMWRFMSFGDRHGSSRRSQEGIPKTRQMSLRQQRKSGILDRATEGIPRWDGLSRVKSWSTHRKSKSTYRPYPVNTQSSPVVTHTHVRRTHTHTPHYQQCTHRNQYTRRNQHTPRNPHVTRSGQTRFVQTRSGQSRPDPIRPPKNSSKKSADGAGLSWLDPSWFGSCRSSSLICKNIEIDVSWNCIIEDGKAQWTCHFK